MANLFPVEGVSASHAPGSVPVGSEPGGDGLLRGLLDAGDGITGRLAGRLAVELVEPDLGPLAHDVAGGMAVFTDDLFGGRVSGKLSRGE